MEKFHSLYCGVDKYLQRYVRRKWQCGRWGQKVLVVRATGLVRKRDYFVEKSLRSGVLMSDQR